jgi:hypothetical protein
VVESGRRAVLGSAVERPLVVTRLGALAVGALVVGASVVTVAVGAGVDEGASGVDPMPPAQMTAPATAAEAAAARSTPGRRV